MWLKTYGNLYKKLAHTTYEIPIGLYRTNNDDTRREFFFVIFFVLSKTYFFQLFNHSNQVKLKI